ncbi:hypothetical protein [Laribacter hongkongensis]|uniref:hypothetical protein n=1 Tax=Laribacter hongkongensis TaxID=168471 RepID=UPI0006860847|nr:hypothetical protein [Laribacter hongkongensis]
MDSLFNLLNSAHSLNDKMKSELSSDFFDTNEFVAIKALRNLFHHKQELLHEVRAIAAQDIPPIISDLLFLCLVPRSLVEEAISEVAPKYKAREEAIIRKTFHWYGNVVNINPCIFNFAIHVYEKTKELGLSLSSDEYMNIEESYLLEEQNGYSHFITGQLSCRVGDVETVLKTVFADVA